MDFPKSRAIDFVLLFSVSIIWGSQFVFNKMALPYFTPTEIAFIRSVVGMLTLSVLWLLTSKDYKKSFAPIENKFKFNVLLFSIALFEATIPFLLIPWGQQHIDSGIAAILIGTIPIFVVLINFIYMRSIRFKALFSIIIGFAGVTILLLPGVSTNNFFSHIQGELAVLAGAISFAISLFLIRRLPAISEIMSARIILLWATIQIVPFLLLGNSQIPVAVDIAALGAVAILGVFCAGIVYVFYVMLTNRAGVVFASFSNYLVPLIGFSFGILFFKEAVQMNFIFALALILVALFFGC